MWTALPNEPGGERTLGAGERGIAEAWSVAGIAIGQLQCAGAGETHGGIEGGRKALQGGVWRIDYRIV